MNTVRVYSTVCPGFHSLVGVHHVNEDAIVLVEVSVVGHDELVGNVDRAAKRGAIAVHGNGGGRNRGSGWLSLLACAAGKAGDQSG